MDLPVWQAIYGGIKDKNVELISFAEDSGGEKAAATWFDRVTPTFIQVVDGEKTSRLNGKP